MAASTLVETPALQILQWNLVHPDQQELVQIVSSAIACLTPIAQEFRGHTDRLGLSERMLYWIDLAIAKSRSHWTEDDLEQVCRAAVKLRYEILRDPLTDLPYNRVVLERGWVWEADALKLYLEKRSQSPWGGDQSPWDGETISLELRTHEFAMRMIAWYEDFAAQVAPVKRYSTALVPAAPRKERIEAAMPPDVGMMVAAQRFLSQQKAKKDAEERLKEHWKQGDLTRLRLEQQTKKQMDAIAALIEKREAELQLLLSTIDESNRGKEEVLRSSIDDLQQTLAALRSNYEELTKKSDLQEETIWKLQREISRLQRDLNNLKDELNDSSCTIS